jgi:hypothetical protein
MTGSFILIMVLTQGRGIEVLQQEFANVKACEAARVQIAKVHDTSVHVSVASQGCYAKGDGAGAAR